MNRKQRRNKKAKKVSQWIIDSILKLDNENLLSFYELILKELNDRGVIECLKL